MYQLVYISTATTGANADSVSAILEVSRRNNRRDGITGLLLYDGRRFLQVLEGPQPLVDEAFVRIKADVRHRAAVMLHARHGDGRSFGQWDMAGEMVAPAGDGRSLADTVDRLVEHSTDRNLKALFKSFARIDRAA